MAKEVDNIYPNFEDYGKATFYEFIDFDDDKARTKFIKSVEKIIRSSLEYRNYIKYLKVDALLNYCTIFNKLPEEVSSMLKIEFHHHPITLYDIVETVLKKYLSQGRNGEFTMISIANEVMLDHYLGHIGLVPLTLTAHQLAHSSEHPIIHKNEIIGDYRKWMEKYKFHLDLHLCKKVESFEDTQNEIIVTNKNHYFQIDEKLFIEDDSNKIEDIFLSD